MTPKEGMKVKFKHNDQIAEGTIIWISRSCGGYVVKDHSTLKDILNPEILEEIKP